LIRLDDLQPRVRRPGVFHVSGGVPTLRPEPVTLDEAARLAQVSRNTIGVWVHRYGIRRLGRYGRRVYVDWWDDAAVEWCLRTGRPVPPTPDERAALMHDTDV